MDRDIWSVGHRELCEYCLEPIQTRRGSGGQTPSDFDYEIRQLTSITSRFWLACSPSRRPSPFARQAFEQTLSEAGFEACSPMLANSELQLALFARMSALTTRTSRFGSGIVLRLLSRIEPNHSYASPVLLYWELEESAPSSTYSAGVYLIDESGSVVAQSDNGLSPETNSCQITGLELKRLRPGGYSVMIAVHDWRTFERLPVIMDDSETGDMAILGELDWAPAG